MDTDDEEVFEMKRFRKMIETKKVLLAMICVAGFCGTAWSEGERWQVALPRDEFDAGALLDLRELNEEEAGETGWVKGDGEGGFVLGDGSPQRFWAVNTTVARTIPFEARPAEGWGDEPDLNRHARWLAKRGVNLVRLHAHINPHANAESIETANEEELDWIWRTVGAMKAEGVYSVVSPYWANTMESDDAAWGTDWNGKHHGLLFFEETLQNAYKAWLKELFTTPSEHLGGKTLAEEPALAIFQIQNEDSLLFWTVDGLPEGPKKRLGGAFFSWAVEKYGSIEAAYAYWGDRYKERDSVEEEVLGFASLWDLTSDGKAAVGEQPRLDDQLQFWVETMRTFNAEIMRYIREDLNCPVLVNSGNWKTADVVYLEDSERYTNAVSDIVAVNRYFSGVHSGVNRGWAIESGHFYSDASVLSDKTLSFPLSVKQAKGKPMMVTESAWVMPVGTAFESPLLIGSYSSLLGIDAYFWFSVGTEGFVQPRSANGFSDSQEKWICMTPDVAGQWPGAALAFRKGYIKEADTVLSEHRSLDGLWQRKSPLLGETASFDPNRDSGDLPPDSGVDVAVDPHAFLIGPVESVFGSPESQSSINLPIEDFYETLEDGVRVRSATGELLLDTSKKRLLIESPYAQGIVEYEEGEERLSDTRFKFEGAPLSALAISLDGHPLRGSAKVLVQVATPARPHNWEEEEAVEVISGDTVRGKRILSFGEAPWEMEVVDLKVEILNPNLTQARALDLNGMPVADVELETIDGGVRFQFPEGTVYVVLQGNRGDDYAMWAEDLNLTEGASGDPDHDSVANLLEFVSSGEPLKVRTDDGAVILEMEQGEGGTYLDIQYKSRLSLSGVLDGFEISEDLRKWTRLSQLLSKYSFEDERVVSEGDAVGEAQVSLRLQVSKSVEHVYLRRFVEVLPVL